MKKYCYFISTTWRDSAVSNHFKRLAEELVSKGHKVVLLIDNNPKNIEYEKYCFKIYKWPSSCLQLRNFKNFIFLYKLIKKHRPDCLIGNFSSVKFLMITGWLMGVPIRVAWYRTMTPAIDLASPNPKWKNKLLRFRANLYYKITTHLIPVSKEAMEDLRLIHNVPPSKCYVFHNALSDPLDKTNFDFRYLSKKRRNLVCVGGLNKIKGQDVLIKALSILKSRGISVDIDFLGNGPLRKSYSELAAKLGIQDKCHFLGGISHNDVLKRLKLAYLSILPSHDDNCPWAIIESLSMGTPVIASKVGGIPELIQDRIDGFLVPPDDPKALAEKIALLLSDKKLRDKMGKNARKKFLEKFEQKNSIKNQIEFFEKIIP